MRTTLYSRLKPNYKAIVEEKLIHYGATGRGVKDSLEKTLYSRLTIGEVTDLTVFIGLYDRTDSEWFSGKDLFELENGVA